MKELFSNLEDNWKEEGEEEGFTHAHLSKQSNSQ